MPKTKSKMKTANILTVGQMIDSAFGNVDVNVVNFKMLQTVLILLARQLRLLNRQVALESESPIPTSNTNTVVTEIKIAQPSKRYIKKIEARTSKSYEGNKFLQNINNSIEMMDEDEVTELSTNQFDGRLTYVWSSGGNSEGHSVIKSETSSYRTEQYYKLLEKIEVEREKVLRVIQQRKNSRDGGTMAPTPMTSMPSSEIELQKKLLVVGHRKEEEKETHKSLPFVTWEQFNELSQTVRKLEERPQGDEFGSVYFPENIQLMQDLRKGASLTDAMAALQISSRLDAAEKALRNIAALLGKSTIFTQTTAVAQHTQESVSVNTEPPPQDMAMSSGQYITKTDLKILMDEEEKAIMGKVNNLLQRTNSIIGGMTELSRKLEIVLGDSLGMKEKIQDLENNLISNSHQLGLIDAGLTSQMTNLQEQLSRVQVDLDTELDNMHESLMHKGVDSEVLTELTRKITNIQTNINRSGATQRELNENQKQLAMGIDRLLYDVEMLRDSKCDRDEVIDALRDKAGIKDLNGMVSEAQFLQTFASLEERIMDAYETFRKQEISWQKAINDIFDRMDEKVDSYVLSGFRNDVNVHLNKLKQLIDSIKKVLGEPLAASTTRRIYRDTACLSCANPAAIMPNSNVPTFPPLRPPGVGAESLSKSKDREEHYEFHPCIPGLKITHSIDPRAEMCTRYCGGAHTKSGVGVTRQINKLHVEGRPLLKPVVIDTVTHGKIYQTEDELVQKPCFPCNQEYGAGEGTFEGLKQNKSDDHINKRRISSTGKCVCGEESPVPQSTPTMDDESEMLNPSIPASSIYSNE